jgi:hypothetical protein
MSFSASVKRYKITIILSPVLGHKMLDRGGKSTRLLKTSLPKDDIYDVTDIWRGMLAVGEGTRRSLQRRREVIGSGQQMLRGVWFIDLQGPPPKNLPQPSRVTVTSITSQKEWRAGVKEL